MINYTSQKITKVLGLIALTGLSSLISAQTLNWKPAGPIYNAGRARNMVVDKNNSDVLYVGSASSGIFKSYNSGALWMPINDQDKIRNISYLAQAADGVLYAGTGEGFLRAGQKAKAQIGTGLYKLDESATPAATLNLVAPSSVVGTIINRVACDPANASHMALASDMGIMVSTGSGFAAASLPGAPTGTTIAGLDVKFDSNGILYCSIGAAVGNPTVAPGSKIYKSTDASLTSFIDITPVSNFLPDNIFGRIELAIAPSDNNVIYASCANKYNSIVSATLKGLFVSYDAGATWALILQGSAQLDPLSDFGIIASGDYAQALMVSPSNPHQLFFGSYYLYSWTRTSTSNTNPVGDWIWLNTSPNPNSQSYLHENIHDIKFVQGTLPKFYFVTDAGIFRSVDLAPLLPFLYNNTLPNYPSFQRFYKGLVTGQFNSVSIERYPIGQNAGTTVSGTRVDPYSGFIGGTGGNGLTYFSGTDSTVSSELSYIGGEIYNAEYSKILPDAALASTGDGTLYRSTNVKNSPPGVVKVNQYINALSKIAPQPENFSTNGVTTGVPFKMWENYYQVSPDSAVFYNDSIRYQASMSGVQELTTSTTFTFSTSRPNQYAMIDSVVVRTGTVQLPLTGTYANLQTPFNAPGDGQTIYTKLPDNYTLSPTTTTLSAPAVGVSTTAVTFTFNSAALIDNFTVKFMAPPFSTKTITAYPPNATPTAIIVPDAASYYRVFATVYYRYKPGDIVSVVDNNISTRTNSYTAVLTQSLNWEYGSISPGGASVLTSTSTLAVTGPTYVLTSNSPLDQPVTSSNPTFAVNPSATTSYTIRQFGTFTLTADAITYTVGADPTTYTLTATVNPTLTSPVYSISPGNYTQTSNVFTVQPVATNGSTYTIQSGTTIDTFTFGPTSFSINPAVNTETTIAPNVFVVSPTVSTTYTITQTTGASTVDTYSTIGTSTYVLNPGNITQENDSVFIVTVNTSSAATVYTITGTSSNTLSAPSVTNTFNFPVTTTSVVTITGSLPIAKNNKPIKIPSRLGARIALILNNAGNTANSDAVLVSKNPLALNDPLSLVRVSQVNIPIYTDDATGNPTNSVITVSGKPVLLEWSKSGTELYYATNTNKVYRVSHIYTIMDLSPSSYSGKFYNDIFKYTAPIGTASLNPESPFRTTLIGSFDKPITSISVSSDNKNLAVIFNSPATGTTSTVMYNTNDARVSTEASIGWVSKQGTLPGTVNVTYCSLMDKDNSKKVYVGTDNGIFYTTDISAGSPTWNNVNDNATSLLPRVQVFDIKQQTMNPWDCYNSGQIYVATNGRGVWTNGEYTPYIVGIDEYQKPALNGKNLSIYPNPTNGNVHVAFNSVDGETATLQIMDISGRIVQSEEIGKLSPGEVDYVFGTTALTSGVYVVNISSNSGVKRVSKLIVTK